MIEKKVRTKEKASAKILQKIPRGSAPAKKKEESAVAIYRTVGRRKSAIARVQIVQGSGTFLVNNKPYQEYFPLQELQRIVESPLNAINQLQSFTISVKVQGGGFRGQAEAIRHGLARAVVLVDNELRKTMRGLGYMTRDSRVKERKKPGLKRARRAPQFSKR